MYLVLCNRSSNADTLAQTFSRQIKGEDKVVAVFKQGDWGVLEHPTDSDLVARTFAFRNDGATPTKEFSVYNLDLEEDVEALRARPINASPLELPPDQLSIRLLSLSNPAYLEALVATEEARPHPRHDSIEIIRERIQALRDRQMLAAVATKLKIELPDASSRIPQVNAGGTGGAHTDSKGEGGGEPPADSGDSAEGDGLPPAGDDSAADGGSESGDSRLRGNGDSVKEDPPETPPTKTTPKPTGGRAKGGGKSKGAGKGAGKGKGGRKSGK